MKGWRPVITLLARVALQAQALELARADNGNQSTLVQATNRRGKTIQCRVTCSPLVADDKAVRGVIVVEEPDPPPATG